uniref:Uncharacterized protein n=1 Tax=Megaselia scalaris TaxID=36166 RepID=T1GI64_MEGSC
MQVLPNQEVFQ